MKRSSMGFWWFYFLVKFYLHFKGSLHLDFLWNIAFLIFLKISLPEKFREKRFPRILKHALSGIWAVLLLWHESWFPPIPDFLKFLWREDLPEANYIFRFLAGFFDPVGIAVMISILVLCLVIQRYITLTPVVVLLLLGVPIGDYGQAHGDPEDFLSSFYRSEADRRIDFGKRGGTDPDFDIILLHVCSLSWDDLRKTGLEKDPFLQSFDILFTRFNSATSYSNPSAIRLLRANCGQSRHEDLYRQVSGDCYLMDSLRADGYQTYSLFNHDGKYGHFGEELKSLGHLDPPVSVADLPVRRISFEGSPIYDDYAALAAGWNFRQERGSPRAAFYYNTITLHDGSHRSDDPEWWKRDRGGDYRASVEKLFADMTRFFELLAASDRNALVVFIPEHGMALEGDPLQAPGLREIPLPRIALVPVGIKWIGKKDGGEVFQHQEISKPTSYLAVSSLFSALLRTPSSELPGATFQRIVATVPGTEFVAENDKVRVVNKEGAYFLENRASGVRWIKISAGN